MPAKSALTPDALLSRFPAPIVDLANVLRLLVQQAVPDAREVAYAGWKALGYRHAKAGYLGGIFLFEDRVAVIFEHGHLLPDPNCLLQGSTKQTRHLTLRPEETVPREGLTGLLHAAVDIGKELRAAHRA